jgi:hypothetical protein
MRRSLVDILNNGNFKLRYNFRINTMFYSTLPSVVCFIYVICVCLRIVVTDIYCVVFFALLAFVLCLVFTM